MEEKKYYCLVLSGCYDTVNHYICSKEHSVMKNVLRKEYTDLTHLEEDFMEYDDTITIQEDNWLVEGSFPVIAYEKDGKMIDCISHKIIYSSNDPHALTGLNYKDKSLARKEMVELLLNILDEESKERYIKEQNKLEEYLLSTYSMNYPHKKYYFLDIGVEFPVLISAVKINDTMLDMLTLKPIIEAKENLITSKLTYHKAIRTNLESINNDIMHNIRDNKMADYVSSIDETIISSSKRYNNYRSLNKDKEFNTELNYTSSHKVKVLK